MKKRSGNEIRQLFLDYFESRGHTIEPSASLVPVEDPTLLWINSGVAALKKYFDGTQKPINPRITNAQKSIRTNDIENVGLTARHHTFFEMLGNFSIGDYFKKEAIDFAWCFLTDANYIGFDKDKLYITVHPIDQEAYDYWVNVIGVNPSNMLKTEDNFWQIGEGPCGPNSEIFYDRGDDYDPDKKGIELFRKELENDRYVEVWNLVFSQYNAKEGVDRSDYLELPQRNIDTGMGLERLACVVQDVETNFDTDLFTPIIEAIATMTSHTYQTNKMAYKIIADHIRTITFALADGAQFSNEGRGYVLRRLLRRSARYGLKLDLPTNFLETLVDSVVVAMGTYYDYLLEKVDYIKKMIRLEAAKFSATLVEGERILHTMISDGKLSGVEAFKLYDTYGFPIELTLEICGERNITVDTKSFEEEMQKQRQRAREARLTTESMHSQSSDLLNFTEPSTFDYSYQVVDATVIGLFKDGKQVMVIEDEGDMILDQTYFYAESGGQTYDTGTVSGVNGKAEIKSVIKAPNKQHFHHIVVTSGTLKVGDTLHLKVDEARHKRIEANHTATHLLHQALKTVLGGHIAQAGSQVNEVSTRFDFTHFEKVSTEELSRIEAMVNQVIFDGVEVKTTLMSLEESKKSGAMAFFNEKYEAEVRVVTAGDFSAELCGGTHVRSTAMIGLFKIVSESSIGSGIRRIEAVTGEAAYQLTRQHETMITHIAQALKLNSIEHSVEKTLQLVQEYQSSKKQVTELKRELAQLKTKDISAHIEVINGINVVIQTVANQDSAAMKTLANSLKKSIDSGIVLLVTEEKPVTFVIAVSDDLIKKQFKAGDLIKQICSVNEGRGGGKPDLAQGGCKPDVSTEAILSTFKEIVGNNSNFD